MTNTKLKIIALIAMLIDHIGYFIPDTPEWFRWIGRIAAPVFVYCIVVGYKNTSNKRKYLIRLYLFNVGMALVNLLINMNRYTLVRTGAIPVHDYYITNNIFSLLFFIVFLLLLLENRKIKSFFLLIAWQPISTVLFYLIIEEYKLFVPAGVDSTYPFLGSVLGNVLFMEGSILFVILGVIFYFADGDKIKDAVGYILFCVVIFLVIQKVGPMRVDIFSLLVSFGDLLVPFGDDQWMMIFALPLILLYNGKRGIGLKYFFYIFYPVHIVILFFVGLWLR